MGTKDLLEQRDALLTDLAAAYAREDELKRRIMSVYGAILGVAAGMARGEVMVDVDTRRWARARAKAHHDAMGQVQERVTGRAVLLRELADELYRSTKATGATAEVAGE